MSKKVLTISVAAYNVEQYIRQCLDSLLVPEVLDKLEVFVVDDNGTDGTLEIVREYERRYPGTFYAVHKENGGYGTTVNYSLAHATGAYFKLLDGDDWFDSKGLRRLVGDLETSSADALVVDYSKGPQADKMVRVDCGTRSAGAKDRNGLQSIVGHWGLVYRTELLRRSGLELPMKMLYTDKLYSTIPLAFAKSVQALPYIVYCYRVGRDGQSVSRVSRIRHRDDYIALCKMLCSFVVEKGIAVDDYVYKRVVSDYRAVIRTILLSKPSKADKELCKAFDTQMRVKYPQLYRTATSGSKKMGLLLTLLRCTGYMAYWPIAAAPKRLIDF